MQLHEYQAKVCYTAAGHLIVDEKILLIKHKKLQSWLSPGGHIDENELPHQAAEREFFEESGVKVRAVSYNPVPLQFKDAELLPQPLLINLHWVSKANYDSRFKIKDSRSRSDTNTDTDTNTISNPWKKGCEQHLGFLYLLEPVGSLDFYQNEEETDGIAWFGLDELADIEILENVRKEIEYTFKLNLI